MDQLIRIEGEFQRLVTIFERAEEHSSSINRTTLENTNKIFIVMRKIFATNLLCLHHILTFLSDGDLFRMAASCKTLYRYRGVLPKHRLFAFRVQDSEDATSSHSGGTQG